MKACLLFVLIIFTSNTFSQNVSPQFSELKGMEDQSGNTHLFYKFCTSFANDHIYEWNDQIFELRFTILQVYDVLGNEIATLVNEEKRAGSYEVEFNSHSGSVRNLPSGIYFYQLKTSSFVETKKMIIVK